jgi:transposase InsO family protein
MTGPGVDPNVGEEIARRLRFSAKGEKAAIVQEYMDMMGWSKGTVYRVARQFGFAGFGKPRSDKGRRKMSPEQIQTAAAISYRSKRKTERIIMPTWKIKEVMEDNKILQPGQVSGSTINRYFREMGLNQAALLSPTAHVNLASLHPNHVHQLDSSVCVQYDFKEKGKRWEMVDRDMKLAFYKNKPQYFKEIKKILLRYLITDHTSGTIFPYYFYVRGEDTKTLVEFVMRAWAAKADPHLFPFQGVPLILMCDAGSANISAPFRTLVKNLKVQLIVHEPGNPRAIGQVESAQGTWERAFESELSLEKAPDIEQLNARCYDYAMQFNATRNLKRTGMPRFALWQTIAKEQLRFLPSEEICRKLISGKDFAAVCDGAKQIRIDGRVYEVRGEVRRGMRMKITPDFYNPAQFQVEDEAGRIYQTAAVMTNKYGFREDAAVIGQSFKSHAYDKTQRFIADAESGKVDISKVKPQLQKAKVEGLHYLARPGVPALGAVDAAIPVYSSYEARGMVRERLGLARLTAIQAQLLDRYLREQMSEEQIEEAAASMRRHLGLPDAGTEGREDAGKGGEAEGLKVAVARQ